MDSQVNKQQRRNCLENRTKMRPCKSCNTKMQTLFKLKGENSYTSQNKLSNIEIRF